MVFKNIDGKEYKLSTAKYLKKRTNCSNLHKTAREILDRLYGSLTVLEEVKIKTKPLTTKDLFLDFYIASINRAYEVQGQQHFQFNSYFHSSKQDFFEQRKRDRIKEEWCEINEIKLIKLDYDKIDDWERKIREY